MQQELIKILESSETSSHLIMILDDLQALKSIQTSAILSWLPWNLPANVHLICSVNASAESVLSILRSRISNDYFIHLPPISCPAVAVNLTQVKLRERKIRLTPQSWSVACHRIHELCAVAAAAAPPPTSSAALLASSNGKDASINVSQPATAATTTNSGEASINSSSGNSIQQVTPLFLDLLVSNVFSNWSLEEAADDDTVKEMTESDIPANIDEMVNTILDQLESLFGRILVSKLSLYIGLTRYGFREPEILELISTEQESNYESVWSDMKCLLVRSSHPMGHLGCGLLHESHVLGRTYYYWSHDVITSAVRCRYLTSGSLERHVHGELAQAFFLGFREVRPSSCFLLASSLSLPLFAARFFRGMRLPLL